MSDYFDRVERQIVRRVETGVPRPRRLPSPFGHLGLVAAVLVVILVAGVSLLARSPSQTSSTAPTTGAHGVSVWFATPGPVAAATKARTTQILRARLHQAVPGAQVSWAGGRIDVRVTNPRRGARAEILALSAPGRLEFYDWEASVIAPNGNTVASLLQAHDPPAIVMSQGSGTAAPGDPGLGSLSLARARQLAAKEPASTRVTLVQAARQGAAGSAAQFYVLRGAPALSGASITDPRPSAIAGGTAVSFRFTAAGSRGFRALTAAIARRGARVSSVGQTLNQHFAIVLDNHLIDVPYVDYKQYPDGISDQDGAELIGGFPKQSAKDIAILLRYGPLPVNLTATG
ncbi:MAG TPA: hypothetical protein VMF57_14750 [Solirubrobacteraceae bacterium]|nr:hypothetical protein [Solirubrobacteraceae bacterium]